MSLKFCFFREILGESRPGGGKGDWRRCGGGKEEEKKKGKRQKKKRKEKKIKYRGIFGIIRKIDLSRVAKYNLGQLEGTFLLFFKTCVHLCYLRQLEGTKMQLSLFINDQKIFFDICKCIF